MRRMNFKTKRCIAIILLFLISFLIVLSSVFGVFSYSSENYNTTVVVSSGGAPSQTETYKNNVIVSIISGNVFSELYSTFIGFFNTLGGYDLLPGVSIERLHPLNNIFITKDKMFNVTINVTCLYNDCGDIDVSLFLKGVEGWNVSYEREEGDVVSGIALDSEGNVYVAGVLGDEWFVVKHDSNGNQIWNLTHDSEEGSSALKVAIDSEDNVYVVGRLDGKI
jgi:hypothetical protein